MPFQIKLRWKIVTRLTSLEAREKLLTGLLFNQRGGRSFIRSIGGRIQTTYEPILLEPTDVLHQALAKGKNSLDLVGNKFPYEIAGFPAEISNRLNVTIRLFGQFICITLELSPFSVSADTDLLQLQNLESHPRLLEFVRLLGGIITQADRNAKPLPSLPKCFSAIQIVSTDTKEILSDINLVELVTHHSLPRESVVADVIRKNQPHLVDRSTLLIDKQGIVSYVPEDAQPTLQGNTQRFDNASSMLELAAIIKAHFDANIQLPTDVERIISSPEDAIHDSVSAQNTWNLVVKEFKLRDLLLKSPEKKMQRSKERILIVAVTSVEIDAIRSAFEVETGQSAKPLKVEGYIYQFLGEIGDFDVFLSISEMGTGGISGSQESIRKAINALSPAATFMVGIAFGVNKKKFSIGDILVSKQLLFYELQRINADATFNLRGDRVPASPEPLNWVRHAISSWSGNSSIKVESGLLLSGEKLIDNIDFRDQLAAKVSDALGGEMEGAGLYVACANSGVPWILIKAICDWADGKKSKNKLVNQKLAATNASAFVLHLLKFAGNGKE
ncbi:5'-methylthioadenosine/S-adenosylhomocysteine nucleosidase family protein [Duganella aceris]|uniref:Nucleoside phosphorylase domain-containing protein n=1 Tax=Duganella aceris TaxID=2703883 RepID=A0ABX0FST9_9BURK|nr:hypothetical protein [Duganella aceris]NGZ87524.1 hypothetical protein [Duganella aceris]